ncbi:hypothetical protein E2C01_071011 [Portunus trituberculatus]|uniref:Uncharacterized protein n=1 Tax=Portunus trituberculatus TaxID=210409 RepID=A0A5B7I704_PORTR|nr:hypothetical protein [Portunus trituberculatus]
MTYSYRNIMKVKSLYLFIEFRKKKIHAWYNARCIQAKKAKNKGNDDNRWQYKDAQNEYTVLK